jgi:hypothetical protein
VIRQLCPHCLKLAELPDSAAGSKVNCPSCAKAFDVPAAYSPNVDANAGPGSDPRKPFTPPEPPKVEAVNPPPGLVIPQQQQAATSQTSATSASASDSSSNSAYSNNWGVSLSPQILQWIPVACLTLIVLMTVFPWIGSYPGGTRVYSQYPWQAIFGNFERNPALEDLLKDEQAIEAKIGWNFWLMIYLPLLLATVFLAWVERVVQDPKPETAPPLLAWLPNIWHARFSLLTGLSLLIYLILLFQSWQGFSLEVAIRKIVVEKYADDAAKAVTTPAKQRVSVQVGQDLAARGLQNTLVLNFVFVLHIVAVVVMALRWWQNYRGATKPAPWIGVRF